MAAFAFAFIPNDHMREASLRSLTKTVASTATPEALASATVQFTDIKFIGQKAFEVNNATDVLIQILDVTDAWVDHKRIAPGDEFTFVAPTDSAWRGTEFRIKVGTNNDGVRCEVSLLV